MINKLTYEEALAKIKVKMSKHFEDIGREVIGEFDLDIERSNLIEEIDIILKDVDIPAKNLIIEKLQLDNDGERGFLKWA